MFKQVISAPIQQWISFFFRLIITTLLMDLLVQNIVIQAVTNTRTMLEHKKIQQHKNNSVTQNDVSALHEIVT